MIKELTPSSGSVVGFEITDKVTFEEEKRWLAKLDAVVKTHGQVSVLVVLDQDAGWGVKAGLADLKWIISHMKKFNKVALVTDSVVWEWLIGVDSYFAKMVGVGEKHFTTADLDAAWDWIKE